MTDIDNTQDMLDVRDIIARVEELENEMPEGDNVRNWTDADEYATLNGLLEQMSGNGGDEEWRGHWYPITLIRDSHFEDAMDEMLEDCGDLKPYADRPCYITITIDYKALQMDYTSVEYDGVTYWYR